MIPGPARVMYCGRCGAPLAPGSGFCGRCGTPVALPASPAPVPAYAGPPVYAGPPAYAYPQAPPHVAYPTARQFRLSQGMVVGGLIVIVLVIAAAVGGIAVAQFANATHSTCTSNCGPKFVTPLPEQASYKSSAYRYQVNYFSKWTVRAQDANGITLGTKYGSVQVMGSSAGNPPQVLQQTVNQLPSSRYQDVTLVGDLKGAHVGNQDGVGAVYSANFVGTSQTATKVRFAVIVATQRGVTIVVFAIDPADPKNSPNGIPEGQLFDYLCTEIVW